MLDGTDAHFMYGQPQFKLQNAAHVELVVEITDQVVFALPEVLCLFFSRSQGLIKHMSFQQGVIRASKPDKSEKEDVGDAPLNPMKSMFKQWAKGEQSPDEVSVGTDMKGIFKAWATSSQDVEEVVDEKPLELGALFKSWADSSVASKVNSQ